MKYIIFLLCIISATKTLAQSIFEVKKNAHLVGYIAGGMHYGNADVLNKKTNSYQKIISLVDAVYIEADPNKKISDEHRANIYLNNGDSLESLSYAGDFTCLKGLFQSKQLDKWRTSSVIWYKSGPAAFIYQFGQAQLKIKSGQEANFYFGESIDKKIVKIAKENKKPVFELEGFDKIFTTALSQKNEQLIEVAEAVCKSASSPEIIELAKIDVHEFIQNFESSDIDSIRKDFIKSQKMMGWSDAFMYYNLRYRDKQNAINIDKNIFNTKSKYLIVVGVAHLGGNGLIDNLREMGYEVSVFDK